MEIRIVAQTVLWGLVILGIIVWQILLQKALVSQKICQINKIFTHPFLAIQGYSSKNCEIFLLSDYVTFHIVKVSSFKNFWFSK